VIRLPARPLSTWAALLCLLAVTQSAWSLVERPIELPAKPLPRDVVLVSVYTNGQSDPQGRGIGVFTGDGAAVPFNLFSHDPAGESWLAIDLSSRPAKLLLKYAKTSLRDAKPDDRITPSLILQTFALTVPNYVSESDLFNIARTAVPLGAMPVEQINHAFHPFGPDKKYVSLYRGLMRSKDAMKLFSVHRDSGYIELDGKMLSGSLESNLTRDSVSLASQAKPVSLDGGLHLVRYVHAAREGPPLAMLGMVNPKGRAVPVPANLFVHDARATLGDAVDAKSLGFDAEQIDQLVFSEVVFSRWRFHAIAPISKGVALKWTFSDGTAVTSEGRNVEHIFAGRGDELGAWQVRLERVGEAVRAESLIRPVRSFDQGSINDEATMRAYAAAIGSHDLSKAGADLLTELYSLLWTMERVDLVAPVAEAYVARFGTRDDPLTWDITCNLATFLVQSDPSRAADLFRQLAQSTKDTWRSACAAAWYLDVLIFDLDRGEQARNLAPRLAAGREARERSLLMARQGDIVRLKGDADAAMEAYQRAQRLISREMSAREAAVVERAHREAALTYLKEGRLPALRDALFQWEADFPTAKLGGDLPLLTGEYFQAVGDHRRALAEYESLLAINPLHPSRPEILYRMALSMTKLGRKEDAAKCLEELRMKYPNSPFAKSGGQ